MVWKNNVMCLISTFILLCLLFALKCFFKWSNIEFALSLLSVLIYRTYYLESLIDEVFL